MFARITYYHLCLQSAFVYVYFLSVTALICTSVLCYPDKTDIWSELKAPSFNQIDCKWHLTKWLIRVVVSSLQCRDYPIRQTLTDQGETKLEEKDREHFPSHCLMRWTNTQILANRFFSTQIYIRTLMKKPVIVFNIHSHIDTT